MSIRKKCGQAKWRCPYRDHRCNNHPWMSELMVDGIRRPPVSIDDYALARGATGHVVSKREADDWERQIRTGLEIRTRSTQTPTRRDGWLVPCGRDA